MTCLLAVKILPTYSENAICFIICQILFGVTYYAFKAEKPSPWPWIMMLVVCLTFFFDTDYFSYRIDFGRGLAIVGRKEPFYILLAELSGWNYTIWRMIVWGTALTLYYYTGKRLGLESNITIYTLVFLFNGLFAYGRVNLAMATYFFGFSSLTKPMENNSWLSYILGCCIIPLSFLAHRTFLPVILLTPLMLITMTKLRFLLLICFIPVIIVGINYVFSSFLTSDIQMGDSFSNFQASAERAAGLASKTGRNWKSMLVYQARLFSFYIPFIYIGWQLFISRTEYIIDTYILKYFTAITVIVAVAFSVLYGLRTGDAEITGMRYLYMTGIPLCLLLAYLYQNGHISFKTLNLLILLGFVSFEGNFIIYMIIHGLLS